MTNTLKTYKIVVNKDKHQDFLFTLENEYPSRLSLEGCISSGYYYIYTLNVINMNEDRKKLAALQDRFL